MPDRRIGVIVQDCEVVPARPDGGLALKLVTNPYETRVMESEPNLGVLPNRLQDLVPILR
jgi:hypothetical protein